MRRLVREMTANREQPPLPVDPEAEARTKARLEKRQERLRLKRLLRRAGH